jgi:hypothetical protein
MVPKHNFIGPFKLFLFIGLEEAEAFCNFGFLELKLQEISKIFFQKTGIRF